MRTLTQNELTTIHGGLNLDVGKTLFFSTAGTVGGFFIGAAAMSTGSNWYFPDLGAMLGAPIGAFVGMVGGTTTGILFSNIDVSVSSRKSNDEAL